MSTVFDVAVVGGGIAGLTAAHHAALEGCTVAHCIGSGVPGGLVANVGELEAFPSAGPVAALDVALRLGEEIRQLGVEIIPEDVDALVVDGQSRRLHVGGSAITAKAVIVASGASLRMLDVPGAARLLDKGVSQCAWCNGSLYRDKEVVVVGGGDSALQEALHLAKFATLVTIVTRGEALKARSSLIDRAANCERIAFRWQSTITEIVGEECVTGVRLMDGATAVTDDVPCAGVFVYVGLEANTKWLQGALTLDATGCVVTTADLATSLPGVYAAGAVRSGYLGRLTNAVGEATTAALAATRYARNR